MTEEMAKYEIKVGQHGKGCECSHCQPVKNTFLNDIGHTHTCRCIECQGINKDCHNCGRPADGQVCTMSKTDINTCLQNKSRPFWKPKTVEKTCRTCARRLENEGQVCPLEPGVRDECVRDFWSMWETEVNGEHVKEINRYQEGMPCDFCSHHVNAEPSFCVTCDSENSNYDGYEFVVQAEDTITKNAHDVDELIQERLCGTCDSFIDGLCTITPQSIYECLKSDDLCYWSSREEDTIKKNDHDPWAEADRCQACRFVLQVGSEYPCIECEDGSEYVGVDDTIKKNDHDIEADYRPGSTVSKQYARIKELVDAHWSYQEKLLSAGQDKKQMFTWDQVMEMRKWDYTSAATHFYGHGYEDAQEINIEYVPRGVKDIFANLKAKGKI